MKTRLYIVLALLATMLVGCKEEGADLRPGLYVNTDLIDAFPGKEVRISGQASCCTGLKTVTIRCEAWKIDVVDEIGAQNPVVWNFAYSFVVPDDAKFPQELHITATDKYGTEMKKVITVRYVPATTAPYVDGLQKQMAVDYDDEAGQGVYTLKAKLYGEDKLRDLFIEIPAESVKETIALSKREEDIVWLHTFKAKGSYPMTLTVTDHSGNVTVSEHQLIVMKPEQVDEVSDYTEMWAFKTAANESDYIFGFYQYMDRKDDYQYEVHVYAESDETAFMFSPTQETNGERKFGESPFVEDRIISMQSDPSYVKGYKPGKGYWGLYVDIREKTIKKWALDNSSASMNTLYVAADWNSWTFDAMKTAETPYQQKIDVTIKKGNQYFSFYTVKDDWGHVWRCWKTDGGDVAGWWYSEANEGDSGQLPTITEDVNATVVFDTAIKWCYIIKK